MASKGKSGTRNRKGGGGKGGSGGGGGGGGAPPQPPSNRSLAAIARFNGIMQDEQQQFQPVRPTATLAATPLPVSRAALALLRAPGVGRHSSTRVDEGRKS